MRKWSIFAVQDLRSKSLIDDSKNVFLLFLSFSFYYSSHTWLCSFGWLPRVCITCLIRVVCRIIVRFKPLTTLSQRSTRSMHGSKISSRSNGLHVCTNKEYRMKSLRVSESGIKSHAIISNISANSFIGAVRVALDIIAALSSRSQIIACLGVNHVYLMQRLCQIASVLTKRARVYLIR